MERWRPEEYDDVVATIPGYLRLQDEAVRATLGLAPQRMLELGTGTGETAARLLAAHPGAAMVSLDGSVEMLAAAAARLPAERVELVAGRLEDALPDGPFDLVVSALAVHHLQDAAKRDLFRRVAALLAPGGRFVLADVVRPHDPADARVEIEEGYDLPSAVDEQLAWLSEAGLEARLAWAEADLAVLTADAAGIVCSPFLGDLRRSRGWEPESHARGRSRKPMIKRPRSGRKCGLQVRVFPVERYERPH